MKVNISTEEYHKLNTLSFSSLSRFVTYTIWGERTTNYLSYAYPPKREETDAMLLGTLVDAILTEGMEYEEGAETLGEYQIVSKRTGKFEKEINQTQAQEVYDKVNAIKNIPPVYAVFERAEKQVVLTDDTLLPLPIRGKLDLLDHANKAIIDLKCSGVSIAAWEKDLLDPKTRIPSPYARVVRQLAFYRMLCRANNIEATTSQVVLNASDGVKVYQIPESAIELAEKIIRSDVDDLLEHIAEDRIVTIYPETVTLPDSNETTISIADF